MQDFLQAYLQNSLITSIIVLLIFALSPLLSRKYMAKCRYYLWFAVVLALIIPFRPQILISQTYSSFFPWLTQGISETVNAQNIVASANPAWNWWQTATILWIAGVFCCFCWFGFHHIRFMQTVKRWNEKIDSPDIRKEFRRIKSELGINHIISIRYCSCIQTPMMVGLLKPVILLPRIDIDLDDLKLILKHELVHYKRKDMWYKLLIMIASALHWFNPLVHIMAKSILNLCEISCDEAVLKGADSKTRARYGEAIISIIRKDGFCNTALSTNFYSGIKGIKKRIYAIMDTKSKRFSFAALIIVVVFTFFATTAFASVKYSASIPDNDDEVPAQSDYLKSKTAIPTPNTENTVNSNKTSLSLNENTYDNADETQLLVDDDSSTSLLSNEEESVLKPDAEPDYSVADDDSESWQLQPGSPNTPDGNWLEPTGEDAILIPSE